jgi:ABC-2 type transport system ATP-binding protein
MQFEVCDIHKRFGEKQVLKGVSFAAESGRALGLLGRNGAGKTTAIRIVMGVFPPNSGRVLLDGRPIDHSRTPVGYLPEEHGLYPKKKIVEQLTYLCELRGIRRTEARASIDKWLRRLEVGEYASRKLDTLSKGNQQKIQLVAALVTEPRFVILDEPFSGLDPVNAALLKDVVKELITLGCIVLFSSHQMSYVEEFCDSIAILHHGRIALAGSIEGIKRGYDRSVMTIRARNLAAVEAWCADKLADMVKGSERRAGQLLLKLDDPARKAALMAALAEHGPDVDAVAVFEPTLADIFVEYTGDEDARPDGVVQGGEPA